MLLLDVLHQRCTSDSTPPEQKSLCQLLYDKIASKDMMLMDFYRDEEETRALAAALDMYKPGDILSSIFADDAKLFLAKVIDGYHPNYTHDPNIYFASDSDSEDKP